VLKINLLWFLGRGNSARFPCISRKIPPKRALERKNPLTAAQDSPVLDKGPRRIPPTWRRFCARFPLEVGPRLEEKGALRKIPPRICAGFPL